MHKTDPLNLEVQHRLAAMYYRLGYVAQRQVGFAPIVAALEASRHFSECLKLRRDLAAVDPGDAQAKIELMLVLGRLGRAAEAEKLADQLLALSNPDLQVTFQIACGLAVAGGNASDPAISRRCKDRAVEVLGDLANRQWKSPALLELDPDLESLRDDDRFAKIVHRLMSGRKQ
jgi:tetratricopeptide (TPR) repeat protein